MSRKPRRRCACGAMVQTLAHILQPKCQMCRREALGLGPNATKQDYWRARWRMRRNAELREVLR